MLVDTAPASGTGTGTITIGSDDPTANPFVTTLHTPVLDASAPVLYQLDFTALHAATLAGAHAPISPAQSGTLTSYYFTAATTR